MLHHGATPLTDKSALRTRMRAARGEHVAALPASTRALVMHRPPGPVLARVPEDAVVGLYVSTPDEAPSGGYARFFHERGNTVALPWFADRTAPMEFRTWADPIGAQDLAAGPVGPQPADDAAPVRPSVLFVPLLAFTLTGDRLGQGGGHYDRWLESNPDAVRIGLAWDVQEVPELPVEPHDMALDLVVTPTRVLGPFR
nr:5-formyltetrahydrofolate cyclo-ligase [Tsuneonella amylolytica]